jgi:biotin synthase
MAGDGNVEKISRYVVRSCPDRPGGSVRLSADPTIAEAAMNNPPVLRPGKTVHCDTSALAYQRPIFPMSLEISEKPVQLHRPAPSASAPLTPVRWSVDAIQELLNRPLMDLLFEAQTIHRQYWPAGDIELATLLSVKTGGCPENCGYCPQSAEFDTGVKPEKLMALKDVVSAAQAAKDAGATRFCMGAAWRAPKDRDIEQVAALVSAVRDLGLQTCATLGMLEPQQARALKDAGLDYYNHNLDSAPEYYTDVVSTRVYQDRLDTLQHVRSAGISVCCGGIVGMGETPVHRAGLIAQLANLDPYPESVPINSLVRVPGTPLADSEPIDPLDFVRVIAVARITMPKARVRLSAGRQQMGEPVQALCFMAGANSIFYGDKLLVTGNSDVEADTRLLAKLGLKSRSATLTAQG